MFFQVSKLNDKFFFTAAENDKVSSDRRFNSYDDFYLTRGVQPTYDYYGEARAAAMRMITMNSSAILARASFDTLDPKEQLITQFNSQLSILGKRFKDAEYEKVDSKQKEEYIVITRSLHGVIGEILSLVENLKDEEDVSELENVSREMAKLKNKVDKKLDELKVPDEQRLPTPEAPPEGAGGGGGLGEMMASTKRMIDLDKESVILDYSESLIDAFKFAHPSVYVEDIREIDSKYVITMSIDDTEFFDAFFDENLLFYEIIPSHSFIKDFPLCSKKHYTYFLEPAINSIGHYYDRDKDIVVVPCHPSSTRLSMAAFTLDDNKHVHYNVSFEKDSALENVWVSTVGERSPVVRRPLKAEGSEKYIGENVTANANGKKISGSIVDSEYAGERLLFKIQSGSVGQNIVVAAENVEAV